MGSAGSTVSKCKAVSRAQAVVPRASVTDQQTEPILSLFWELEGVGVSDNPGKFPNLHTVEELIVGIKTIDRRYEVRLPWREDIALGDSRSVAERRFCLLSRRLASSPGHMCKYNAEMRLTGRRRSRDGYG
ncbi:hypothetical protein HPB50_015369 [Hyalomma asiaticum]|uniref:Uncharacterized protein n=1 Tax=Hyalomma asiaticum TaxID=266040 RepID=A0ACB7TKY6_HYAAI|nr:hypothetical protein HPB50_015369 [Hyalomma asiaticum]